MIIPVSAVIATRNRAQSLSRTFSSLLSQDLVPAEIILVDASTNAATKKVFDEFKQRISPSTSVHWSVAEIAGAASQRNQGVADATQPLIWFLDDDIVLEPKCIDRLWSAIESDRNLGGAGAMIANQRYQKPGVVSRALFTLMHGRREESFAGRVIGPAINLLPEDRDDLPKIVPVEWLNTTCTFYRREALPNPPFDSFFTGYSLMEDLVLSLRVAKYWKLANVRTARIFHNSQHSEYKADPRAMAMNELINRHYVMTKVLQRNGTIDYFKLLGWELFQLTACAVRRDTRQLFFPTLQGSFCAAKQMFHDG